MCSFHFEKLLAKWREQSIESPDGCLLWTGARNRKGYGIVNWQRDCIGLHRLVYIMFTGTAPEVVRHTCDTPMCWNFLHLIGGTHGDNVADKVAKNRQARGIGPAGSRNGMSRLTEAEVLKIKLSKLSLIDLANQYRVGLSTISMIRNNKTWKHVDANINK